MPRKTIPVQTKAAFLRDAFLLFVGVVVAAWLTPSITYDSNGTLIMVAVTLSVLNLFLKPLLILMALPFVILTLGIGIWIINAALLSLVSFLIPGFAVTGFGSALIGAFVISLTQLLLSLLFAPRKIRVRVHRGIGLNPSPKTKRSPKREDIIDI